MSISWSEQHQSYSPDRSNGKSRTGSKGSWGFLKIAGIIIISILLFLALFAFGPAFLINRTVLNPHFVTKELDRLDLAVLADDLLTEQTGEDFPEEIADAVSGTVAKLEPRLKEEINTSIYSLYDYLLGRRDSPELAGMLRNTFLSEDFLSELIDELDIRALIIPVVREQVENSIPEGLEFLDSYINSGIDDLLVNEEPWLRDQLKDAAGPLADYLTGERETLYFSIPTGPLVEDLREILLQDIDELPIPGIEGLPPALVEMAFNGFYKKFTEFIPPSIEIDETIIGEDVPDEIMASIAEAESSLGEMRDYVHTFRLGYFILIAVMVLLAGGIFLIYRELKGTMRILGIIFMVFGICELLFYMVARNVVGAQLEQLENVPEQLHLWLQQLAVHAMSTLQILGIGFIVGGVALLVLSFVGKTRNAAEQW